MNLSAISLRLGDNGSDFKEVCPRLGAVTAGCEPGRRYKAKHSRGIKKLAEVEEKRWAELGTIAYPAVRQR